MTKKLNTKGMLIETASRLFRMRGYDGVGLNDILKESGIPKGSLYHYFPEGKEGLAVEAIRHTKGVVIGFIEEVFERTEDPIKAVQDHICELAKVMRDEKEPVGFPIGAIASEKHSTSEPIRKACHSAFEEWKETYSRKFIKAGYSEKQAEDFGIIILAVIEGGILLSLTAKSNKPLRVIAEQIPMLLTKKSG
ncbi:TetR/AcrR family transcriptional regulator [Domibacillus sp. DTU_2020_1001157_1_SI_ALB_TIR_016]|uniref:TetR/AcrR family transcriptional regulator n=1 Tax=Domibacillus sp. DTU_2020_1001157_1_SI_ALB_TIR_016 TaxID=3077789 RepID=UPI0028ED1BAF|nr:TetR/AcrR family transcriptional regulator [Domibacillus sp. DTU_2020_1001157_1_SI_ALB_TIR_016]WNS78875.1 TetR/AcrR family transcriptional regulator [Domibacillus sp. DTU_2020_1001157_1_SI_ALB_TIR_016]